MKTSLAAAVTLVLGLSFGCAEPQTNQESSKQSGAQENPEAPVVEDVDVAGAAKLIAESDVIILDIRTPGEFQRGHLVGAINIDYSAGDYAEKLGQLDKGKTYVMH